MKCTPFFQQRPLRQCSIPCTDRSRCFLTIQVGHANFSVKKDHFNVKIHPNVTVGSKSRTVRHTSSLSISNPFYTIKLEPRTPLPWRSTRYLYDLWGLHSFHSFWDATDVFANTSGLHNVHSMFPWFVGILVFIRWFCKSPGCSGAVFWHESKGIFVRS